MKKREYKKKRLEDARKLITDNFGTEIFRLLERRYPIDQEEKDTQGKVYVFLVEKNFSYREIGELLKKSHESVRYTVKRVESEKSKAESELFSSLQMKGGVSPIVMGEAEGLMPKAEENNKEDLRSRIYDLRKERADKRQSAPAENYETWNMEHGAEIGVTGSRVKPGMTQSVVEEEEEEPLKERSKIYDLGLLHSTIKCNTQFFKNF